MREPRENPRLEAAARRAERRLAALERHMETSWYEWSLRELARYLYGLGMLIIVLMVPLQMADSWLPPDRPPIVEPPFVAALAILFVATFLYLGVQGYLFLWREGGLVDRRMKERFGSSQTLKSESDSSPRP